MPSGLSRLAPAARGSALWRSLTVRLAIAALPLWVTIAVLIFNVDWRIKLVVGTVFGVTLAAPAQGLLLAAVLAPLGQLIAEFVFPNTFRIGEAIVVAFLAGWLLRGSANRPGPRIPAPRVAALFAVLVVASIAGVAWRIGDRRELVRLAGDIYGFYYQMYERVGLLAGARLLEGLGLAAATVALFRRHPAVSVALPAALAAAGSIAAATSLLLWFGVGSATALERYSKIGYRVSAHVADVNAAGSYFAMIACLALGMALRTGGRARALWAAAAAINFVGLWLSASRSALLAAAMVLVAAAMWTLTPRWKQSTRAIALSGIVVVAVSLGALWAWQLGQDSGYRGAGMRQQFNATSLRMMQASPVFGVGVGQYYPLSSNFLTPELAWTYGSENAHNYFLQVGAELGLLGLALVASWLVAGAVRAGRALAIGPRDWRLLGAAAGVLAYVGTSFTGHPFLVDEVTYPFWMQVGLVVGLAGSVLLNGELPRHRLQPRTPPAWSWREALLAGGVAVLAAVGVATRVIEPPASQAIDGFYEWETGPDGTPFRWTRRYASLFVPSDATSVNVQVRMPTGQPALKPMGVDVMIAGREAASTFASDSWTTLNLELPDLDPPSGFTRIDLRVHHTWQPALYIPGSADMREVGVQVTAPQVQ